jgi:hypothetical protein
VEADIIGKGILPRDQPKVDCPEVDVETLTTLDSRHYTTVYNHLLAWFGYASELLAAVQARVLQYETVLKILRSQFRKTMREKNHEQRKTLGKDEYKKMSSEDIEDYLLVNPEYQEVLRLLQVQKQHKYILQAKVDDLQHSLSVISRQVEIRRLDQEQHRNSYNMPGRNRRDPITNEYSEDGTPILSPRRP